uniref:SAM domain-containing protein n=1 Tax=Romanomermis culicivorax TaxID=13658 RepID=A0A915HIL8_ROMCU
MMNFVKVTSKCEELQADLPEVIVEQSQGKDLPRFHATTPRASAVSSSPKILRDLPSNVPLPGQYGFKFFINEISDKNVNKKAISYTFSVDKNKLYIRINETCPISFKVEKIPPMQSYIRATAIYSKPQDLGEAVKRCMTHVDKDKMVLLVKRYFRIGMILLDVDIYFAMERVNRCEDLPEPPRSHFVRCSNVGAVYAENPETERQSVIIPYQAPEKGTNFSTYYFQFSCFSSCSGSINRRPVQLIFTLEYENQILGRQVLDLRVCSCPGRDKEVDDMPKRRPEKVDRVTTLTSVADPAPKRRMVDEAPSTNGVYYNDDSEIFTVQVRGRELYKIVQTIVQNFEIARNVSELAALRSCNNAAERRGNGRATPPSSLSPVRITDGDENIETKTSKQQRCTLSKRQNSQLQQQNLEQLIGKLSQEKKLSGSSPISSWLENMSMQNYIPKFESNGLYQMDQLKNISHEELRSIGIENDKDLDRLYESIIRFKLACEFGESLGYGSSQQGIGPEPSLGQSLQEPASPSRHPPAQLQ